MVDLHTHVLAALDDGPQTFAEALGQLKVASESGVTIVAATPHVSARYPTTADAMEQGVAFLNDELIRHGFPVRIVAGGEIASDQLPNISSSDLRRFSLGGGGRYLLVELPSEGASAGTMSALRALVQQGLSPVIAHPERQADVQQRPGRASSLVRSGCLLQVTASSLTGLHGRAAAAAARSLMADRLVHIVASDMHGPSIRRASLREGCKAIGDEASARWLTSIMPRALLAGSALPGRPAAARRRWLHVRR